MREAVPAGGSSRRALRPVRPPSGGRHTELPLERTAEGLLRVIADGVSDLLHGPSSDYAVWMQPVTRDLNHNLAIGLNVSHGCGSR
jgi:hypothetical protein